MSKTGLDMIVIGGVGEKKFEVSFVWGIGSDRGLCCTVQLHIKV